MKTVDEARAQSAEINLKMAEAMASLRQSIGNIPAMLDRAGDAELLKLLKSEGANPSLFEALQAMLRQLLMTAAVYDEVVKGIQARAANLLARAQGQQPPPSTLN